MILNVFNCINLQVLLVVTVKLHVVTKVSWIVGWEHLVKNMYLDTLLKYTINKKEDKKTVRKIKKNLTPVRKNTMLLCGI